MNESRIQDHVFGVYFDFFSVKNVDQIFHRKMNYNLSFYIIFLKQRHMMNNNKSQKYL